MITGESFVYYGPEAWDSMWRNRHHLLSRLAHGNRVVYVEPRPYVEEVVRTPLARGEARLRLVRENLWVYRPPRIAPLGGPPPLRALTHMIRRLDLNRALAQLGIRCPIVFISTPTQYDARNDVAARLRIYHIVDEYLAYHDLPAHHRAVFAQKEQDLIRWADRVLVVSQELLNTKGLDNPKFRLLQNAVDESAYQVQQTPQPTALASLNSPILGYIGLISARLDLALLDDLAAAQPAWSFVLLGTLYRNGCEEVLDRLVARANVHFLAPVSGEEVARYVRWFDVGLAPYRVTLETMHASPLKVYEYLAAGLPVVATPVPGALAFKSVVTLASGFEAWCAAIEDALAPENRTPALADARREAVARHTWAARVEALSDMLQEAMAQTSTRGSRDQQ